MIEISQHWGLACNVQERFMQEALIRCPRSSILALFSEKKTHQYLPSHYPEQRVNNGFDVDDGRIEKLDAGTACVAQ